MAESQHILRLKATLDTSEVKTKLEQLRQAQKQAMAGGQASTATGGLSAGNLNSTLMRLNATMMQLQRAIQQLSIVGSKGISPSNSRYIPIISNRQVQTGNVSSPQPTQWKPASNYFEKMIRGLYKQQEQAIGWANKNGRAFSIGMTRPLTYALDTTASGLHRMQHPAFYTKKEYRQFYHRVRQDMGLDETGGVTPEMVRRGFFRPYTRPIANEWSKKIPSIYGTRQRGFNGNVKGILGFGIGHVLNPMGEYAAATGNTALGTSLGMAGNVATGAAAGFMFGGPAGAAIGAGAALLGSAFEKLTERANALSDALKEQEDRVKQAKDVDKDLKSKMQAETDAKRLRVGDVGYFQGRIDFKKGLLSKLTKQQEEIGLEPGSLTAYEEETQRQIEAFRAGSPTGELPEEIKRRQRIANRYKANIGTIEQIKSDISGYEGNLESLGVLSEKKQEAKDFQENSKRQEQWRLVAMRDIFQGDYDSIDARKKALYREAEAKGTTVSLDKLEELQDQLDALDDKLKVINTELDRRADELKAQRARERDDKIEQLQETLSNMKAPNMQGISNMASFGMGGSMADDKQRLDSMVKYNEDQLNIQRQIRDLVREKKDEATPTAYQ